MSRRLVQFYLLVAITAGTSLAPAAGRAQAIVPASPTAGTLAGVVRDTLGRPLNRAEVLIPELSRSVRTDSLGTFALEDVVPGAHEVWIRSLGYIVVQFEWASRANSRIEVAITMRPLPNTLEPMTVWANEEKTMRSRSMISGVVVDSAGNPIEGADVSLIGGGRGTVSAADGSFVFRHAPTGNVAVRSRLLGYAPAVIRFNLLDDDERKVYLRMTPLAYQLDEQRITAESGYGFPAINAWKDLDQRSRWRHAAGSSVFLGPEKLATLGGMPLDLAMAGVPRGRGQRPGSAKPSSKGVCILEDGFRQSNRPLSSYAADEVDLVEYYPPPPPETDWTGTVALRMQGSCRGEVGRHPAYYVLWLKRAK